MKIKFNIPEINYETKKEEEEAHSIVRFATGDSITGVLVLSETRELTEKMIKIFEKHFGKKQIIEYEKE